MSEKKPPGRIKVIRSTVVISQKGPSEVLHEEHTRTALTEPRPELDIRIPSRGSGKVIGEDADRRKLKARMRLVSWAFRATWFSLLAIHAYRAYRDLGGQGG